MPAIASNIPTPQLALNNKANMGLPSLGGFGQGSTQTSSPIQNANSYVSPGTVGAPMGPIASALGKVGSFIQNVQSPGYSSFNQSPQPSTPLKSTTTTAPNGASVTHTFHAVPTPPTTATGGSGALPPAPTAPLASANPEPSYNPNQPATTVYNNGVGTTNQGNGAVSGYSPATNNTATNPTYNSTTGSTASNPTQSNTNANTGAYANGGSPIVPGQLNTYPGIVSGLAATSAQGSPAAQGYTAQTAQYGAGNIPLGQEAQQVLNQYGLAYNNATQQGTSQEGHEMTTGGLSGVGEGNAAVTAGVLAQQQQGIAQSANTALSGINSQITAQNNAAGASNEAAGQANTGQGLVQSGLGAAGQLAAPGTANVSVGAGNTLVNSQGQTVASGPQQLPYNQQLVNTSTGAPIGGAAGTSTNGAVGTSADAQAALSVLPASAQSAVQLQAQLVQSGQSTQPQALSNLTAYGQAGANALNALLGPNFNVNASNASAGTTATGQQLKTQSAAVNAALDTLSTTFNSLNPLETGGIPATNGIAQWIGAKMGSTALQSYNSNLADARSQLLGVLNSAGGTPTGNENTVMEYLPSDMTAAQFATNVGTEQSPGIVRQLINQKVQAFTGSGASSQTANTQTPASNAATTGGWGSITY